MRNWTTGLRFVGVLAVATACVGCERQVYHGQGDPGTQPKVSSDMPEANVSEAKKPEPKAQPKAESKPVKPAQEAQAKPREYKTTQQWLDHDPKPSLNGLDRSEWEKVTFKTDPGRVEHYNFYHRDLPTGYEKRHDEQLRRAYNGDPAATLEGYKTEGYNGDNSAEIFTQQFKFAFDTVVMFPWMVVAPPWGTDYTPRKLTDAPAVKDRPTDITSVPSQPATTEPVGTLPKLGPWPTDDAATPAAATPAKQAPAKPAQPKEVPALEVPAEPAPQTAPRKEEPAKGGAKKKDEGFKPVYIPPLEIESGSGM